MSNEELKIIKDFLNDDEEAFEKIVHKYLKSVYNFIHLMINDFDILDDLTQETFIKIWKNRKNINLEKNFKSWIFTVAKNTVFDYLKKKNTVPFSDFTNEEGINQLENIPEDKILPDELLEKIEKEKDFEKKLQELPESYRLILILHYKEDFSLPEISKIFKESYNTTKSRHLRALLAFKKIIQK